jgi:hypothetical protein
MPGILPPEANNANAADIYSASWVVITDSDPESAEAKRRQKDAEEYFKVVDWGVAQKKFPASQREAYYYNAYSTSSFIAIKMFLTGLERLKEAGKPYTAENYLDVMESKRCPVALSGGVDFSGGKRIGLDSLSFVKYQRPSGDTPAYFQEIEPMASIEEILEKLAQ